MRQLTTHRASLRRKARSALLGVSCSLLAISAHGVTLTAGDVVVLDAPATAAEPAQLVHVDPLTGTQTLIANVAGSSNNVRGFTVGSDGFIYFVNRASASLLRVDPADGSSTTIASGGGLSGAFDIAVESSGDYLILSSDPSIGLFRVDALTGAQSSLSVAGLFNNPLSFDIDATGEIFVADFSAFSGTTGGVIRVDPATGSQTGLASGGNFQNPFGLAIEGDGTIFVSDSGDATQGLIIAVDPISGAQTLISSDFANPLGLAVEANGQVLVAQPDFGMPQPNQGDLAGAVLRLDPSSGAITVVSSEGLFSNPSRVTLAPTLSVPEPRLAQLLLASVVAGRFIMRRYKELSCVTLSRDSTDQML